MPFVRLSCVLLNCMLAGGEREAALEDVLMFGSLGV